MRRLYLCTNKMFGASPHAQKMHLHWTFVSVGKCTISVCDWGKFPLTLYVFKRSQGTRGGAT